jgi:hypothetical protein
VHPIWSDRRRLRVFVVLWLPAGAALGILPLWVAGGALSDAWASALWGTGYGLFLLSSAYVTRAAPIGASSVPRLVATIGTAALITGAVWLEAGKIWFDALTGVAASPSERFSAMAPLAATGAVLAFVAMCAVHYAMSAADERQLALRRALGAEIAAREAELRALRAQVDPHFLFNALHSISALLGSDPRAARAMCLELAEFFRESLRAGAQPRITLAAEAALVRRYLGIEQLRFGDRLRASVKVDPDAEGSLVPPLLIQPLAENAVRHGVATLLEGGDVAIEVTRNDNRIHVSVDNPFEADGRQHGSGVGLTNVRARLESTYNGRASLTVRASDSRFHAAISLPVEESA